MTSNKDNFLYYITPLHPPYLSSCHSSLHQSHLLGFVAHIININTMKVHFLSSKLKPSYLVKHHQHPSPPKTIDAFDSFDFTTSKQYASYLLIRHMNSLARTKEIKIEPASQYPNPRKFCGYSIWYRCVNGESQKPLLISDIQLVSLI
jgi:hypothetical protein